MSELSKLLEVITEVKKEMEKIDPNIKERLDYLNESLVTILDEEETPGGETVFDQKDFAIHLPKLRITEAWGKKGTKDKAIISQYTKNIPGDDPEGKIAALNQILQGTTEMEPGLAQLIATMTVCEILYTLLTDFTEAAGGFIFEGFLAGLFGDDSIQIQSVADLPDMPEGVSGKPITDVILNNKHYSLKLLGPSTGVKGSLSNLIKHFELIDHIIYLDARRVDKNQGLEFSEFEITLPNFMEVMVDPVLKQVTKAVEGDEGEEVVKGGNIAAAPDFKSKLKAIADDKEKVIKTIRIDGFKSAAKKKEAKEDMPDLPGPTTTYSYSPAEDVKTLNEAIGREEMNKVISTLLSTPVETLQKFGPFGITFAESKFEGTKAEQLFGTFGNVEKYKRMVADGASDKDLLAYLMQLPIMTDPKQAERLQFEFTRTQAESITSARHIGTLMIGEDFMQSAWLNYAELLKETIGPVYAELQQFTENLNNYVLGAASADAEGGQARKQYALDAIQDAKDLSEATDKAMKTIEKDQT